MKIVDRLEDTLNGGYGGLYGEVVTEDTYGLREIQKSRADIGLIVDIGANVGCFTRYARELFPSATIIAMEPDAENFIHLKKFTPPDDNIIFLNKALGSGIIWRHIGAPNGAHESYLPVGMGYADSEYVTTLVEGVMLDGIINNFHSAGRKIIKIDVEGAENCIWKHPPSMEILKQFDYIMLELHYCTKICDHASIKEMAESTVKGIMELTKTHDCHYEHIYFYATKK
jgi:FkbM family methyltransferase